MTKQAIFSDTEPRRAPEAERAIVITANAFFSGEVVYLGASGWQPWIGSAAVFEDVASAEQAMTIAARPDLVVGAYVIEVEVVPEAGADKDVLRPVQFREKIRALGPTNYHHGKQQQAGVSDVSL